MRWRRGDRLPDDARVALGLQPRERVLAAAQVAGGGWVAATEVGLLRAGSRIAWADVAYAHWDDEESALTVEPVGDAFPPARVALAEPGRVPETVRERVMASIVVSRRVGVAGGRGVRVVGREVGAPDLMWQVVPDAGVDATDPEVRSVTDALVAQLRDELGR